MGLGMGFTRNGVLRVLGHSADELALFVCYVLFSIHNTCAFFSPVIPTAWLPPSAFQIDTSSVRRAWVCA